ncbi:hypothetical protein GE061_008775 [Apolygus lucorum]|uniref:Bromo domain-containing protein n=1 Tax=Apolygus lucorum TaxID=248454 RepID=A0A8S9WNQ5_APOLU|nr:hypothetical protein GE061_008775 [Apolygus lucorum]
MFSKPVDVNEVPDYLQVIKEPMDLETMMTKIDHLEYTCAQDFLNDIDLLCTNALEYNPDRDPADKQIRHRACYLRDTAYALIKAEMDSDFEINCRQIRDDRKKRMQREEEDVSKVVVKEENEAKDKKIEADSTPSKSPFEPTNLKLSPPGATSSSKKRRRRGAWCKGLIKKPKKQSVETSLNVTNSSKESIDVTCVQMKSSHDKHSSDSVDTSCLNESIAAGEDRVNETLNGYITGATDDSEEEPTDTPKKVIADREALNRLFVDTVEMTGSRNNAERLIDLHGSLSRVIDSYIIKWDRTHLVQDLRDQLRKFEEDTSDEESVSLDVN